MIDVGDYDDDDNDDDAATVDAADADDANDDWSLIYILPSADWSLLAE